MAEEYEQEPQFQAPLIHQLVAYLMGRQTPQWSASQYAMGLGTGPTTQVPLDLQRALGGGFRKVGSALGRPTVRQARSPAGTPDIPSWDAVASTEAPSGRTAFGELMNWLAQRSQQ